MDERGSGIGWNVAIEPCDRTLEFGPFVGLCRKVTLCPPLYLTAGVTFWLAQIADLKRQLGV